MDYTFLVQHNEYFAGAGIIVATLLFASSLLCCGSPKKEVEVEEEYVNVDDRNSRLAFMLMLLLLENKSANRKYIKMAENIGYDHILTNGDLDASEDES